jgi:hypothetical protein
MTSSDSPAQSEWNQRKAAEIHVRFRPTNISGGLFTLLLHLAVLLWFWFSPAHKTGQAPIRQEAMVWVNDVRKQNSPAPPVKVAQAKPQPAPAPRHPHTISRPQPTPPVVVAEKPVPKIQQPEPEQDMSAMINARRARRQALEDQAKAENELAAQGNRTPSAQEIATANVQHSLQQSKKEGTSGIFQIISKGTRVASFSFRGWKADSSNSWRQTYEVDAGLGGDVDLAIVRKMIEIIRTHYNGDFNWESHRLGHVVILSARPADTAGLEDFLLKEFFSTAG